MRSPDILIHELPGQPVVVVQVPQERVMLWVPAEEEGHESKPRTRITEVNTGNCIGILFIV